MWLLSLVVLCTRQDNGERLCVKEIRTEDMTEKELLEARNEVRHSTSPLLLAHGLGLSVAGRDGVVMVVAVVAVVVLLLILVLLIVIVVMVVVVVIVVVVIVVLVVILGVAHSYRSHVFLLGLIRPLLPLKLIGFVYHRCRCCGGGGCGCCCY